MIRRPPRSTQSRSSAASDVYKRQGLVRVTSRGDFDCPVVDLARPWSLLGDPGGLAARRRSPAVGRALLLGAWVRIAISAVGMADPLHWAGQTGVDVEAAPHGLQRFDDPSPRAIMKTVSDPRS